LDHTGKYDIAPLVAMDIATLVTGTDQMPDFMHEGKVGFGAGMVHDGKGFILIGPNPGGLPAAVGIIDDENGDIGLVVVAQVVNFIHVAIGLVGKAPQMNELITRLDIVGLIDMDQPQLDVANAAHAEGLVAPFNSGFDDLADDIAIASGRRLGVGDDESSGSVAAVGTTMSGRVLKRWIVSTKPCMTSITSSRLEPIILRVVAKTDGVPNSSRTKAFQPYRAWPLTGEPRRASV
jgi:hypothetical protein